MDAHRASSMAIEADVLAAQGGDQQAFTRLIETTCTLVSSIALAIVRDPDLSRDIAQDVFLSAWRDIGKLREPTSFLPWLRQATRNRAYHILRGLRRRTRRTAASGTDDLLEAVVDPRPDAHQHLVSLETRHLVATTIERLPVDAREVVTLYYREGRSITQVADLLGLSEPAVRQRLSRARARLRDDLLEHAGDGFRASAPGAAFVAGVAAALTVGAPAASAAATVGITGLKTGSLVAKIVAIVGGAAVGAAGGAAGIVAGLRLQRRLARDEGGAPGASVRADGRGRRCDGIRGRFDAREEVDARLLGSAQRLPCVYGEPRGDLRGMAAPNTAPTVRSRNARGSRVGDAPSPP